MNQFLMQYGSTRELDSFPHIHEFSLLKNNTIHLDSFPVTVSEFLSIYYIIDGKFDWIINGKHQLLYPGDAALVLPGQEVGGAKGFVDIGSFFRLQIWVDEIKGAGVLKLGEWSHLTESECSTIGRIFLTNLISVLKMKEAGNLLDEIRIELQNQEIGYLTRINSLVDSLIIMFARQSPVQGNSRRDFPQTFRNLEQTLRQDLGYQWSVEEMAALVGLGATAFTKQVKAYTGFSPLNYLISIRISEAIKLLKRPNANVTDIALETGFYSSQHFSTTFKKLTGYTPGEFRKRI